MLKATRPQPKKEKAAQHGDPSTAQSELTEAAGGARQTARRNLERKVKTMSENELLERVKRLRELEAITEAANAEAEGLKDEIKAYMLANDVQNMRVGDFKVRYSTVSGSRFDSAAFRQTHAELYRQYSKHYETRRFSIA